MGYVWSLKLVTAARSVRYWKTRKSDILNQRDPDHQVIQLGTDLGIQYQDLTANKICSNLTKARAALKTMQRQAAQLHDEYLEEMVTLMTTQEHTNIATIIKNIQNQEEIKHSFKSLQPISKGAQGGAVSTILVSNTLQSPCIYDDIVSSLQFATGWTSTMDEDEVSARLLLRNKLDLHQVWDTPWAHGPLKDYIGEYGIGSGANDILEGSFNPNTASSLPAVNYWLKHHVWRVAPPNSIKVNLTLT
eukprot:12136946-Ditylum_brightwellii.AAC.2